MYEPSVIPANAGVILSLVYILLQVVRYPRECGGDPMPASVFGKNSTLSPRMRG